MICGVYFILCRVTGKYYIGSSKNILWRWYCHKNGLRKGRHYSKRLQNAWKKYGESQFCFEILEECGASGRFLKEQFYLDASSVGDLYNLSKVALCPEATPAVCEGRSKRAKKQHLIGNFGRASWGPESEKRFSSKMRGSARGPMTFDSRARMIKTKREVEWNRPGRREHQAEIAKALQADPTFRAHLRKQTATYWTAERRAAQSERAKAQGLGVRVR